MASARYIRAKSKRAKERSIKGVEARKQKRIAEASEMRVVGKMVTSGAFGDHVIELLDGDDELYVWLRVDGEIRRPRSANGVRNVVSDWIWKKLNK